MSQATSSRVHFDVDALEVFGDNTQRGTPERNLLMAVLERAILDFVGNDKKEASHAEEWLFGDEVQDKIHSPFTFSWICQQLDLDEKFISQTVKSMPKRGKRRVAPWYFMKGGISTS
ncbi:hypothetical protein EBR25_14510 [bacterium]|nr:hypothetical protein [bacterium]